MAKENAARVRRVEGQLKGFRGDVWLCIYRAVVEVDIQLQKHQPSSYQHQHTLYELF